MAYTTINKSSDYFNTKLYTGNGTTDTAITGVGFQPDFFWGKSRTNNGSHFLVNIVSGVGKHLYSDTTSAETTFAEGVKSFNSDGFTIGTAGDINTNSQNYVAWNWLANGAGVSNTDGSISSTVSASTTSGFSIVSYTGTGANATVGHGLGVAPSMVITKRLSSSDDWIVWQKGLTNPASYLYLNSTSGEMGSVPAYQNITPTATLLYPGTDGRTNGNGQTYISYCFADVKGYSKFGTYTGNGSTDGTFIYTGFKPAFVMAKNIAAGGEWSMCDNRRGTANTANGEFLFAQNSNALNAAVNNWDFVSNGLKARAGYAAHNTSGATYIYMAFAEAPLVGSNGVTAKAR